MNADIRTHYNSAEEFSSLDSSPAGLLASPFAGFPRLKVAAGIEDSLALLRTAVLLARHHGASLFVVLPDAGLARNGSPNSAIEMHLGAAPCSALLSGILDSLEQRLRKMRGGSPSPFVVELSFHADSHAFLVRICHVENGALSSKNQSK